MLIVSFAPSRTLSQVATTYSFSQSAGLYTSLPGGTVIASVGLNNMDDAVFGPVTIPAFTFDGITYTSLYISTNGFITFGGTSPANYDALSSTDTYSGAIAAFSQDLAEASSGVRNISYLQAGNEFIIQWQNVARYSVPGERISFQIRLNTSTNRIDIVYGGTITPGNSTLFPEVGLRGPDNSFATNINNRTVVPGTSAWLNSIPGTDNSSTCYFNFFYSVDSLIKSGTTFTWTPTATDIQGAALASPSQGGCYGRTETVSMNIRNGGGSVIDFSSTPVTVNCDVSGPNPVTFPQVILNTGTLAVNATQTIVMPSVYNMSLPGIYTFNASASIAGDGYISNNSIQTVTINSHTPSVAVSPDTNICSGQSAHLYSTATSYPFTLSKSNNEFLPIPDNTPAGASSVIAISNAPVDASFVKVRIDNLAHTFVSDLTLTLIAPDGSFIRLSDEEGGAGINYFNTLFEPTAVTAISSGTAPFTGSFLPEDPFSTLTGSANGNWTLNIADNSPGDEGTLFGWTLLFDIPNGISSYSWTPSGGLSSAIVSNPDATPGSVTTYVLTVTDESSCSNSDSVTVIVHPFPTVDPPTLSQPTCDTQSGKIEVNASGDGVLEYKLNGGTFQTSNTFSDLPPGNYGITVRSQSSPDCEMNYSNNPVVINALIYNTTSDTAVTACNSYTWNDSAFTASTSYTKHFTNASGCDSAATLNLIINSSNASSATVADCDSYIWNDSTFTTSTTYTKHFTNAAGCDSAATLNLKLNYSSSSSVTKALCAGETYTPPGGTVALDTTGVYITHIQNAAGCDSAITTTLTVYDSILVTSLPGDILCHGGTTSFNVNATGGSGFYLTGTGTIPGQSAGNHTYTVTDDHGCTGSATILINEPSPVSGIASSSPADCPLNNGSATVLPSGGTPGYTYLWSDGQTTQTVVNLAGGTYSVTITDTAGCTGSATVAVNTTGTSSLPAPGPITGPAWVCKGQTNVVYCIDSVPNASSYLWTLPSHASIQSGSTPRCISVFFDVHYAGGSLGVQAINSCGVSGITHLNIPVASAKPAKPTITGPSSVCIPATNTYCVSTVPFATGYNWSVDGGLILVSGQGTTCVVVNAPIGYTGNGHVKVKAFNCLGSSAERKTDVNKVLPLIGAPSFCVANSNDNDSTGVCGGTTHEYQICLLPGASCYTWSAPGNAVIDDRNGHTGNPLTVCSGNQNDVDITFPAGFVSGDVTVYASNACNSSGTGRLTVRAKPGTPVFNSGLQTSGVCRSNGKIYSIRPVANAVSYTWSVPQGVSITNNFGTSIKVNFGNSFSSGTICVKANSLCGSGENACLSVTAAPGQPGIIAGSSYPCKSSTGTYAITSIAGATSYTWTISGGATFFGSTSGSSVLVKFSTASTGSVVLTVKANNACGFSAVRSKNIIINSGCRSLQTQEEHSTSVTELNAYPNPTSGKLNVSFLASGKQKYTLKVADMAGNTLVNRLTVSEEGVNLQELDLGGLAKGLYLLYILNEEEKQVILISLE